MFASAIDPSAAYLLAHLFATVPSLLIVTLIACPAVWSRDPARRARALDTLRLLRKIRTRRRKT